MPAVDPLALVPDPSADTELPAQERERQLAEADRLATGTPSEQGVAHRVYWRFQAWLDPHRDARRIESLIVGDRAALEPLLRRLVFATPDSALGEKALVALGAVLDRLGRAPEAEAVYREALSKLRGRGTENELAANVNLARLFRMAERHPEALVAARRAEALAQVHASGWAIALTRSYVTGSLISLEDWPRVAAALERFATAIPKAPDHRRGLLSISLHGYRSVMRLHEGNAASALLEADAMAAAAQGPEATQAARRWVHLRRAQSLFGLGRAQEGEEALGRARADVGVVDSFFVDVEACAIEREIAASRHVAAVEAAQRLLTSIEGAGPALGTGTRLAQAARVGRALASVSGGESMAQRAFGVAGAAAVIRIVEVDRAVAGFPELGEPSADDLAILDDHRRRMRDEQVSVLDAVAALLLPAVRAGKSSLRELVDLVGPGDYVAVCAWCRRVRGSGGKWLPIQSYVPERAPFEFTHGICPPCRDRAFPV